MSSANVINKLADRIISLESEIIVNEAVRFSDATNTMSFVASQENENTKRMTNCHVRLFTEYLRQQDEIRQPEEIEVTLMDTYLAKFILNVRKNGNASDVDDVGRQYEPGTLMAIHSSIHRYLLSKAYGSNIREDEAFRHSRDVLSAKMKQLKSKGKGNKPNAALVRFEKNLLGQS
jgi:hypothetical protein